MEEESKIDPADEEIKVAEDSTLIEKENEEEKENKAVNGNNVRFTKTNTAKNHEIKEGELNLIKELDTKRKLFYNENISRQEKYWELLKEMLILSNEEGDLVCKWFKARIHAIRSYATQLSAVNDSVANLKSGSTFESIKNNKPLSEGVVSKGQKFHARGAVGAANGDGSLLDELLGMDHVFVKNLVEKLNVLERNGNSALVHRQEEITVQVKNAIDKGNLYIQTMKANDKFIDFLFQNYQKIATDFLQIKPGSDQECKNKSDMWLASLHYETGLAQQRDTWLATLDLMDSLFTELRNLELDRRATFKTAIELMLKMHEDSWGGAPMGIENVETCLKRMDLDGEALHQQIKQTLDQQLVDGGGSLEAKADESFFENLRGPLDSKLIVKASINRRKGFMSYKKKTIVVLSVDHQLHLFDVNQKTTHEDMNGMFKELVPKIDPSNFISMKPKKLKKKFMVKPSKTLNLRYHESGHPEKQKNVSDYENFHVKQIRQKKFLMLKKYNSIKTCNIKANSQGERDEWLTVFRDL